MALSKAEILAAVDRPLEKIEVPEWGGDVYLRILTGTERDAYEEESVRIRGKSVELNRSNMRARLLSRCICDEKGDRLFTDEEAGVLGKKSSAVLDRLFTLAREANGLSEKDVKDIAGN